MTALAADKARAYTAGNEVIGRLPVKAAVKFYVGSCLEWDTSTDGVKAFGGGVGKFAGFAAARADNTTGALGDIKAEVVRKGTVVLVLAAAVALTNLGDIVYASADDDTFNLTVTTNMPIGKIVRVVTAGGSGANEVEVAFEAAGYASV